MGHVQIFNVELADQASGAHLTLAAGREFDGYFYVEFGDLTLRLHPDQAARFAAAVRRLARRRRARTPGPVWTREVGDNVGPKIKLELGLDEDGFVTVEVGSTKIVCGNQQSDDLLYFLGCFADDVAAVDRAAEPRRRSYSPGRDYRSKWMPFWD